MHLYDIIALLLTGLSHVLLYILLIGYYRFSYSMVIVVSSIFTVLLVVVVTVTGYPELNIIMFLLFLLSLGLMQKGLAFQENLYFVLMSLVGISYAKSFILLVSTHIFMLSPLNLYMWTGSLIHLIVSSLIFLSVLIWRRPLQKFALFIVESSLFYVSYAILIAGIGVGFVLNYPASYLLGVLHQQYGQTSIVIAFILFFILLLIVIIGSHLAKERLLQDQQEQLDKEMLNYVEKLELAHEELASFRHDYINILTSLDEGIRTSNLEEIKKVYKNTIAPTAKVMTNQELDITKLSNILIPEVKSVLSVKITVAHQQHVNVLIDLVKPIKSLPLPHIAFIRMITILLDNAIEEAALSKEKMLQIALFELDGCLYFVVKNSCLSTAIDIQEMFQKRYSRKGKNRGYGLFSLKRIIEKQENVSLETTFTAPYFTQTLIIKQQ